MSCSLTASFVRDCDNPTVGGVFEELILINFSDWLDATVTISGSEISDITLASGANAYRLKTIPNQVRPRAVGSKPNGIARYSHEVDAVVDGDDGVAKDFVREMQNGRFVAIVFTNSRQVEVYGERAGLEFSGDFQRNRYEQSGRFTFTLASNEESLEVFESLNYVGTSSPYDFATAKAEIEALVA